jgi:hypothetical protein
VAGQVEDSGVLTVLKPTTREELYRAVKLAAATRSRLISPSGNRSRSKKKWTKSVDQPRQMGVDL